MSESAPDYRTILLQLIGSLTLCDHMGDVSSDVDTALQRAGLVLDWEDLSELGGILGSIGITTLYGTSLAAEVDDGAV